LEAASRGLSQSVLTSSSSSSAAAAASASAASAYSSSSSSSSSGATTSYIESLGLLNYSFPLVSILDKVF
jgi:hypothetical protein